ncbi:uncharacterized protein V6R79_005780 [Siganus canaliculatus]
MERSNDRLYSGPLSQEATKILAVLRRQDLGAARRNRNHIYSSRQMVERCHRSQRELLAQSWWSVSQDESRDSDGQWSTSQASCYESSNPWQSSPSPAPYQSWQMSDCSLSSQASSCSSSSSCWDSSLQRQPPQKEAYYQRPQIHPQPRAYTTGQCLFFTETAAPSSCGDGCSLQIPASPPEHQAAPWSDAADKIRPSFTLTLCTDDEVPNEVLFPKMGHTNTHEEEPNCSTSGAQTEKKASESWNIPRNEIKGAVGSDSGATWTRPLSNLTAEATGGMKCGEEFETVQTGGIRVRLSGRVANQETAFEAHSPKLMRNLVEELRGESQSVAQGGHVLWDETGSAHVLKREMMLTTSITDTEMFDSDVEGEKLGDIGEKEVGDKVCAPEITVVFPVNEDKQPSEGRLTSEISVSLMQTDHEVTPCQNMKLHTENTPGDLDETADGRMTEDSVETGTDTNAEEDMEVEPQCELDHKEVHDLPGKRSTTSPVEQDKTLSPPPAPEDSGRGSGSTKAPSQECRTKRSQFRAPSFRRRHGNMETTNGRITWSSSSEASASTNTFTSGHSFSVQDSQHHLLIPSFSLKRKPETLQHRDDQRPPKIHLNKWEPPHFLKPKTSAPELTTSAPDPQSEVSVPQTTGAALETHKDSCTLKKNQQNQRRKSEESCCDSSQTSSSVTSKQLKPKHRKCRSDQGLNGPKKPQPGEPQNQSKASCLTTTLTSDPRVKDGGALDPDEKRRLLEKARKAKAVVLTLIYRDGTTQLDPEQKLPPPVCGLLMLMKDSLDCRTPEDTLEPGDSLVYSKLEQTPSWAQQQPQQSQGLFTRSVPGIDLMVNPFMLQHLSLKCLYMSMSRRDLLLQVLSASEVVVCYKAKDLLRTVLQLYRRDLSWKQVAGCRIQDPQVSGWLLDPANPSSCYRDLLNKHSKRPHATPALGVKQVSQVIAALASLYRLNMELCSKLQSQGLWELYSSVELNMISVLAAMESHRIHVDKEALKKTSDLLGTKLKQLEQEAHRAAGQIFLVTSNAQLRTVLFEKLCLHERCENKRLPKTISKQQQSTSEAALLQLQDLHPLPKIILEYRQVHKIKSTFVDGILSCMMSKNYISSTWYQTSAVTGRITAKHPNFQALPRQPLQITKTSCIQGKEDEVVTVHPRAMFIPQEGWSFLSADFCQVELRLLAHLSSDPELLRVFSRPEADVFSMLASQWKGVSDSEVTSEDREHAKRIVYSVVYGAGRERLSGILGVSAEQARQFQDHFLQTYREVPAFIQRTIQQCHKQGYVLSIMGRRRTLPNIRSPEWSVRMQAERQAVNFVVQGSTADLCKTAMIKIFNQVSSSSSLSARLIAQLHDELLYEVEDAQVHQFAALVRSTMESLRHIDHLGVHLKVPLKVAVSSGKSWGSMSELHIPPTSPSAPPL